MEQQNLTPRAFEALEAVLVGQPVSASRRKGRSRELFGEWQHSSGMGGAVKRLVGSLYDGGYLINSARSRLAEEMGTRFTDTPKMGEPLDSDNGGLSVKGLEALDARLRAGRRYDPTDTRLQLIKDKLAKRRELDAAYEAFLTSYRDREKAAYNRKRKARAKAKLADTRSALVRVFPHADALTDEAVERLAREIGDADHGYGYVRFLDDADLSAELDEAEKTGTVPGTVGDQMRHDKVTAIRDEFTRRAEQ